MSTPMTADQWLVALHAEGVATAVPYGDWRTLGRDAATGKTFGPVHGVTIHHTAGSSSLGVVHNGTGDLPGPLCHGHLPKSGTVNMISTHRANHAGTFAQNAHDAVLAESGVHPYPDATEPVDGNDSYYGLEIENKGDGVDVYPIGQYIAAVKWATAICRFHGWTENSVIGHKEGTRRKIDPKGPVEGSGTFTMNDFRQDVHNALALPAGVWATDQEDEVALTDAEIDRIAQAAYDKLADGGILNQIDLDRVWGNDIIPAATPPFQNADYFGPDGTTVANPTWTAKYSVFTIVRDVRDTIKRVKELQDAVAAVQTAGVDLDALAVKVADEIYRRMQS